MLDAVKDAGHADNTLVVFTSDQGLAVGGRHGLMGKQNLYEHFKSPLVIAGPGVPKGKSDALVYLFDLFPTLCELAGVDVAEGVRGGESLVPVMAGREERRCATRCSPRTRTCSGWSATGSGSCIWYPKVERFQLFDLAADPDEIKDLSGEAGPRREAGEMKKLLAEQQEKWGDKVMRPWASRLRVSVLSAFQPRSGVRCVAR